MNQVCGSLFSVGLLLTVVGCASIEDLDRLQRQLNNYQSNSVGEVRELRTNLRKVQDQLQGLERKTKTAQDSIDDMRGQLVQIQTEQGTAAASQMAKVQALIQALAQGYQAEAEMYRRHLQRVEQAAKGFEQLSPPVRTAKPTEGQGMSSVFSSEPR